MAGISAIRGVCEGVVSLLGTVYSAAVPAGFPATPAFKVYLANDFKDTTHMQEGVSLFLYRVYVNTSQRAAQQRDLLSGKVRLPALPLELHFFLTIWAKSPSVQQDLLGWTMRTLEDYSILPAPLLNQVNGANFGVDETVEIVAGQLTNEELMRIWDDLHSDYQLSIPYVARVLRIESQREIGDGGAVLTRLIEAGGLNA